MSKAIELPPSLKKLDKAVKGIDFHRREQRVVRNEFMEYLLEKHLYSQSSF